MDPEEEEWRRSKSPMRKKARKQTKKWSNEEDTCLLTLIEKYYGERTAPSSINWAWISSRFPTRNAKQIKERYGNSLYVETKKGHWTYDEVYTLFELQEKWGNAWSKIARLSYLPGRTSYSCKNIFYSKKRTVNKRNRAGGNITKWDLLAELEPPFPVVPDNASGLLSSPSCSSLSSDDDSEPLGNLELLPDVTVAGDTSSSNPGSARSTEVAVEGRTPSPLQEGHTFYSKAITSDIPGCLLPNVLANRSCTDEITDPASFPRGQHLPSPPVLIEDSIGASSEDKSPKVFESLIDFSS